VLHIVRTVSTSQSTATLGKSGPAAWVCLRFKLAGSRATRDWPAAARSHLQGPAAASSFASGRPPQHQTVQARGLVLPKPVAAAHSVRVSASTWRTIIFAVVRIDSQREPQQQAIRPMTALLVLFCILRCGTVHTVTRCEPRPSGTSRTTFVPLLASLMTRYENVPLGAPRQSWKAALATAPGCAAPRAAACRHVGRGAPLPGPACQRRESSHSVLELYFEAWPQTASASCQRRVANRVGLGSEHGLSRGFLISEARQSGQG